MDSKIGRMPTFVRIVREAQSISLQTIAQKLDVWPSALSQYEKSIASLSREKLKLMAPLLNLNPEFIFHGVGNPFLPAGKNKIIKMHFQLLEEDVLTYRRLLDTTIVKHIAEYNDRAEFILLRPQKMPDDKPRLMSRWHRLGYLNFALLVQDQDGNRFLFKEKNNLFFDDDSILRAIIGKDIFPPKYFKNGVVTVDKILFDKIRDWDSLKRTDFDSLITSFESEDPLNCLQSLIGVLKKSDVTEGTKRILDRIEAKIKHGDPNNYERLVHAIIPKVVDLLDKET